MKNLNLPCPVDQAHKIFNLHCNMLICLIQFNVLENVKCGSRKIKNQFNW